MRTNIKQKNNVCLAGSVLLLLTIIVIGCVYLDRVSVNQGTEKDPIYWAKAGEIATFTMEGHIACAEDHGNVRFIAALLAPKSWNIRENTTVTYTATGLEDGVTPYSMSPVPVSSLPKNGGGMTWSDALMAKYGVGVNVLNDMEWVAFQTDKIYSIKNHDKPTFNISFKCKTGPKNLKARIGFFINHSDDGLSSNEDHYKVAYSEQCFEVVEGTGAVTDFCAFHFNKTEPLAGLQDDFITFTFMGDTYPNDLASADAVYMEATAHTDNGNTYKVDEKTEKTLMKKEDRTFNKIFNLTIWPTEFFDIPDGEIITRIDYIFTNRDGKISITGTDDKIAAEGGEVEGEKEPFICELVCE